MPNMDGEYFEDGFKINLGISNNLLGKGQTPIMNMNSSIKTPNIPLNNSSKKEIIIDNDINPIIHSSRIPSNTIISSQQRLIN